jgi:hypothetical protein
MQRLFLVLVLAMLAGCTSTNNSVMTPELMAHAQQMSKFSKYFEGQTIVADKKVRMHAYAELNLKKSRGAEWSPADFSVVVADISEQNIGVKILSIQFIRGTYTNTVQVNKEMWLEPHSVDKVTFTESNVGTYDPELKVVVKFSTIKGPDTCEIALSRITVDEFKTRRKQPAWFWKKI